MPFTLAHPAAILPLRRFCPRYLGFAALVAGSMAPDASYCFGPLHVDQFAHRVPGVFGFGLPAGMAMLAVFYGFRQKAFEWLPVKQRQIFEPLCRQPMPSLLALVVSVVVGAFTHVAWDACTHNRGWVVLRVPMLQFPLFTVGNHNVQLCHFLWYACSFGGVAWLCFEYEKWRQAAETETIRAPGQRLLAKSLLVGFLVLPIEVFHHLVSGPFGFAVVGMCSLMLVILVTLNFGTPLPRPQKES